ncbi:hypothetical protein VTL71DRAFT_2331 [Oculimacula yallundae]
MARLVD